MNEPPSIGLCAQLACIFEATARKPGNVHRFQDFPGLTYVDFVMSAAAIASELEKAPFQPLGQTILQCVSATRRICSTNVNLGTILLLAPIAAVWLDPDPLNRICCYLQGLTIQDAKLTYQAIRLAEPGGLGHVHQADISSEPNLTLREVMTLAKDRDLVAKQYYNGFAQVVDGRVELMRRLKPRDYFWSDEIDDNNSKPLALEEAIVDLHLSALACFSDSLVRRKRGDVEAQELQHLAKAVVDSPRHMRAKPQAALEEWFAAAFPHRNPGTTADLVCASLFVALRTGIIPLPLSPPWAPHLP